MDFSSGTIFKLNIPFNLGVAYCRLDNFTNLSQYYGIVISVFDFFEDIEIKNIDVFNDMPLLMNPIPIAKMPTVSGKFAWKKLGVVGSHSVILPNFKRPTAPGFAWNSIEKYRNMEWNAWIGLTKMAGPCTFDQVRHLEELFIRSTTTIEKRIAMTILRYQGLDVEKFFEKNMYKDYWRTDFNTQRFIPLYKNVPEAIRGKPLIKGFVPDEYLNFNWDKII